MGDKSVQKRKYILEMARKVFVEKGFKKVTMKDIVEACGISRGGLYLYFSDTGQIFLEVMKMESQEADDVFSDSIAEDATAADILFLFPLTQAIYEFYFQSEPVRKGNMLKRQFDSGVKIMERLIAMGVEQGEFSCEDCRGMARHIMFVLEGLEISAQTIGITSEAVDREILFIMKFLGAIEDNAQ